MSHAYALFLCLVLSCTLNGAPKPPAAPKKVQFSWRESAVKDLEALYNMLKANHPGYKKPLPQDHYHQWFDQGYPVAQSRAAMVDSHAGYCAILRYYVNGFKDPHIRFTPYAQESTLLWPGFLLTFKNNSFEVSHVSKEIKDPLPPLGAKLISCDNKNPQLTAYGSIFAFKGIETVEADWHNYASDIIIDDGNPWRTPISSCAFEYKGKVMNVSLSYHPIAATLLARKKEAINPPFKLTTAIREFAHQSVWFCLPTFSSEKIEDVNALRNIINKMPSYKSYQVIVFDLRENQGGNPIFGYKIIQQLYGDSVVKNLQDPSSVSSRTLRLTQLNLDEFQKQLDASEKVFWKESTGSAQPLIASLRKSLTAGDKSFTFEPQTKKATQSIAGRNPVKGQVFVLTNYTVASAALQFTDMLRSIPGVVHVGLPTYSQTQYTGVNKQQLPSGLGTMAFPMLSIDKLEENMLGSRQPEYRYDGDMTDTPALQRWVLQLARKLKKS